MKQIFFTTALAVILSFSSAIAFEMPRPDLQKFKDVFGKVTEVTGEAVDYVKGKVSGPAKNDDSAAASQDGKIFAKVWIEFSDVSNDAMKQAVDADKKSRTLMEFLTAREPRYVRLLKKAQAIMANSEARAQFEMIDELTLRNRKNQETIIRLKRDRIAAPLSSYNPMTDTRESIDRKIADLEAEIQGNLSRLQDLRAELIAIFKKDGLEITQEELNYFIVSAEGSELVRLMSIAVNMKKIHGVIERELLEDRNNVALAKYYTGMYLVSLETYLSAHDAVLEKIPAYRQKIMAIAREAENNREEARKLRSSARDADLRNLEANITINERVMTVAKLYDDMLSKRIDLLHKSRSNVDKRVRIAANTYKTIANGSSLISLINTEAGEFSLLTSFEMPELKMIYDTAMLNAFIEISDRIKAER